MANRERERGKRGERELADQLRRWGWSAARRGQQRAGVDQADVIDGPVGVHFECKRVERLLLDKAFAQAVADAGPEKMPVVATRKNGSPWLAVLRLDDLLGLLAERDGLNGTSAGGALCVPAALADPETAPETGCDAERNLDDSRGLLD